MATAPGAPPLPTSSSSSPPSSSSPSSSKSKSKSPSPTLSPTPSPLLSKDGSEQIEASTGREVGPSWELLLKIFRIAAIFFRSNKRRKARFLLLVVLFLCAISAGMLVLLSYVERDFSTAISNKDIPGFNRSIWKFVAMVIVATPLFAFYDYMQCLLALEWRIWLTDFFLTDYFADRAYFNLKMESKLDNPDQRICEDVASFVKNTVDIIVLTSSKVLKICAFTGVLWSIAPELVYFLLIYSTFGTYFMVRVFGKKIMTLKFQALQKEADFRYSLVRIRDNAESVAFYRGERHEYLSIKGFFQALVLNMRELIVWTRHLSLFSNAYEFAVVIVPSIIIAPRYFAGQVEFGVIAQTGFAFRMILAALSVIVLKFDNFSGLAAQTERLDGLLSALGNHSSEQKHRKMSKNTSKIELEILPDDAMTSLLDFSPFGYISREEGSGLVLKNLCVPTPNLQTLLIKDLDISLTPGESLLVMGPSGCGKSSLLRAISGLWNRGEGLIQALPHSDTFFLPQKAYMPLGSLREQLLFPLSEDKSKFYSDEKLTRCLEEVSLRDVLERVVGGLGAVCDWGSILSSGEQQRLAFARMLLHQPRMAFLDEATSALDSANESHLYNLVKSKIPSYVSVGHRTSLVKFHTYVLTFGENYEWKLCTNKDFECRI